MTWPGISKKLLQKHLEKSEATAKGHMRQQRRNLQSTKKDINAIQAEKEEEEIKIDERTNLVFVDTKEMTD